jgi:hypothetical protein
MTPTHIIALVMKELGLYELKVNASTILGLNMAEALEVVSHPDGSLTLKRPAGVINLETAKFDDVKGKLAAWLKKNGDGQFTLNHVLAEVFGCNPESASHAERERIGQALSALGWVRTARNRGENGRRQFVYGRAKG